MLELFIYARTDRWLYLLQGKGLEERRLVRTNSWKLSRHEFPGRARAHVRARHPGRLAPPHAGVTRTPLVYAVVAAAANVVGALVVALRAKWSTRALDAMIALAAGFMICVSLTDIFPEAIERAGARGAMAALAGYLLVHLTQHMLAPHFHFGEETHEVTELVSMSALAGLLLHTFVDGVAIASAFHVSAALGTIVFLAIVLHKLPEGSPSRASFSRLARGVQERCRRGWRSGCRRSRESW